MSYELSWEHRGVIKRFFGELTPGDIVGSVVESEGDIRFDDLRWVINDFLAITGVSVGLPHVDEVAALDYGASGSNPNIRIAVVSTAPEIIALARHYENSPINAYPIRVFDTLASARAWVVNPSLS